MVIRMTNYEALHYFFSAIETGDQVDVNTQEGHDIYLAAEEALRKVIELENKQDNDGWVSVKDRIPEINGRYMTTARLEKDAEVYDLWFESGKWFVDDEDDEYEGDVIAWQPLPKPYVKESEKNE